MNAHVFCMVGELVPGYIVFESQATLQARSGLVVNYLDYKSTGAACVARCLRRQCTRQHGERKGQEEGFRTRSAVASERRLLHGAPGGRQSGGRRKGSRPDADTINYVEGLRLQSVPETAVTVPEFFDQRRSC